jgi:Integrase core domain
MAGNLKLLNEQVWSADLYLFHLRGENPRNRREREVQELLSSRGDRLFYDSKEVVPLESIDQVLDQIYKQQGLTTIAPMYERIKQSFVGISRRKVADWLAQSEGNQIMAKKTSKKDRYLFSVLTGVTRPGQRIQIDFIDLLKHKKVPGNKGYAYVLVTIDVFSRRVWTKMVKTREAKEYCKALKELIDGPWDGYPDYIGADNEFRSDEFQKLFAGRSKIIYSPPYSPETGNGICERVNGTLKRNLIKAMNIKPNNIRVWVDVWPQVVLNYNNTGHSTTKYAPDVVWLAYLTESDGWEDIIADVFRNNNAYFEKNKSKKKFPPLAVGDSCRVALSTNASIRKELIFRKSTEPNYSIEVYTVSKISPAGRYYLTGKKGRGYTRAQLLKIDPARLRKEEVQPVVRIPRRVIVPQSPIRQVNNLDPFNIVGKRVSIYWDGEKEWFDGRVISYSSSGRFKNSYYISYDDGDKKHESLSNTGADWKII